MRLGWPCHWLGLCFFRKVIGSFILTNKRPTLNKIRFDREAERESWGTEEDMTKNQTNYVDETISFFVSFCLKNKQNKEKPTV